MSLQARDILKSNRRSAFAIERFSVKSGEDKIFGRARQRDDVYDQWLKFLGRNVVPYRLIDRPSRSSEFQVETYSRSSNGFTIGRVGTTAGKAVSSETPPKSGEIGTTALSCTHPCAVALKSLSLVATKLARRRCRCWSIRPNLLCTLCRLIGDLVLLALGGTEDGGSGHLSIRRATLAKVKRVIRARLDDPDLTLMEIAGDCHISLGYLHNLFREDGRTVWEYLKGECLQRARNLLESPAEDTTVTDVALACGFSNMSQFSTAFRRAFGISPRDILRQRGTPV